MAKSLVSQSPVVACVANCNAYVERAGDINADFGAACDYSNEQTNGPKMFAAWVHHRAEAGLTSATTIAKLIADLEKAAISPDRSRDSKVTVSEIIGGRKYI